MWRLRWSAFCRTRLEGHLTSLGVDTLVLAGLNYPTARGRRSPMPTSATTAS